MPQNIRPRPIPDRTRISMKETWEINYWCRTLNCTPQQLRKAMEKAGSSIEAIRSELSMHE